MPIRAHGPTVGPEARVRPAEVAQSAFRAGANGRGIARGRSIRSRVHSKTGILLGKPEMQRSLRRSFGQGYNGGQRTLSFVVRIRRNDDYRPSRALLVPLNRIQGAPVDLSRLDYHSSPSKSRAVPHSQSSISALWRAEFSGSAAIRAKTSPTSSQKIRSSICFSAVSITCALGWPSFTDSLESTPKASPAMRTLDAAFSMLIFYPVSARGRDFARAPVRQRHHQHQGVSRRARRGFDPARPSIAQWLGTGRRTPSCGHP